MGFRYLYGYRYLVHITMLYKDDVSHGVCFRQGHLMILLEKPINGFMILEFYKGSFFSPTNQAVYGIFDGTVSWYDARDLHI
jgi:hypothetical protein